ncbi:MAG: hypothetical protein IAE83_02900 [Anaerolinea sp.]|nr:hypothetical protein [Anaerolinea sp.]CAG0968931.1 Endonuclease MutS2 [Anaerolineae bacterium]
MPEGNDIVSLLWPHAKPSMAPRHWQPNSAADLGLELIIGALNFDGKHADSMRHILLSLCDEPDTIRYRQAIIEDFLSAPGLIEQLESLLPQLSDLTYYAKMSNLQALPFQKTLGRLGELELYMEIIKKLDAAFEEMGTALKSAGLMKLRQMIHQRAQDTTFINMQNILPEMLAKSRGIKSLTLGINLDHNLMPIGATIISINSESFQGLSFIKKLFGGRDDFQGIAQLHSVPMRNVQTADGRLVPTNQRADPMLFPLFKDLDFLIADAFRPVEAALKSFLQVSTEFLAALEPEMVFYLGAVRLIRQMQRAGLPMCRAEVLDQEARQCIIQDCYNLHLALRTISRGGSSALGREVVVNDVKFDDEGRILIITGPNQGGKTTYIQGLALAQLFFQAGLYVPGSKAAISPVDGIYTHFPVEEKPNAHLGRFGEEAQRLHEIFLQVTRYSLVLLNESLSSTASGESLYLGRDIVRSFRLIGLRAAYTTHMHELAGSADALNASTPGDSKVLSLVAMAQSSLSEASGGEIKRTYKIVASPPMGRSYADELAARYGISFEKIVGALKTRKVIDPDMEIT